jgi:DNA-binding Xre family transcriptional regulator
MSGKSVGAWSNLKVILAQKNLSVLDLHHALEARGIAVNVKGLYRLAASGPLWKVDMRIVNAVCQCLGLELGDVIQLQPPALGLQRLDRAKQARMEALMEKNNEGALTEEERETLTRLVEEAQRISLHNGRVLLEQKRRQNEAQGAPANKPVALTP